MSFADLLFNINGLKWTVVTNVTEDSLNHIFSVADENLKVMLAAGWNHGHHFDVKFEL